MRRTDLTYLIIIPIFLVVFVIIHYAFLWLDKANCDAMNGSYSITNDVIMVTSTCKVTDVSTVRTVISEEFCYVNNEMIDCEELEGF